MQHPEPHPADHPDKRSRGERIADRCAGGIGSWRFIGIQTTILICWIIANGLWLANAAWDPYPFILLNLCLSLQAAYTGPVLLLSQNRQSQVDRQRAAHDYEVNQQALRLIREIHERQRRHDDGPIGETTTHHGGDW